MKVFLFSILLSLAFYSGISVGELIVEKKLAAQITVKEESELLKNGVWRGTIPFTVNVHYRDGKAVLVKPAKP